MRDLCVFDLDGTLIAQDSFHLLVRSRIVAQPELALWAVARRLGIISRSTFAERAHQALASAVDPASNPSIVADIVSRILPERERLIRKWRDAGAYTVLLSASPENYVLAVGKVLGFDAAHGSHWRDGHYLHLYGENKRNFLDVHYPASSWTRKYSIADSSSDEALLSCFEIAVRV